MRLFFALQIILILFLCNLFFKPSIKKIPVIVYDVLKLGEKHTLTFFLESYSQSFPGWLHNLKPKNTPCSNSLVNRGVDVLL